MRHRTKNKAFSDYAHSIWIFNEYVDLPRIKKKAIRKKIEKETFYNKKLKRFSLKKGKMRIKMGSRHITIESVIFNIAR